MAVVEVQSKQSPIALGQGSILESRAFIWAIALISLALMLQAEFQFARTVGDLSTLEADNGMRLQEIRDLLAGQGWFDLHQYRYLPPDGTLMHWSRLIDGPIAGLILLFRPLFGAHGAEIAAIVTWPTLLLGACVALLGWALTRMVSARAAAFAMLVAVNIAIFRRLFSFGEIDHHNVQALLILGAAICFAIAPARRHAPAIAGFLAALSLAVGLESLLFVASIGVLFALAWIVDPHQARPFRHFAATLALGSLAAFAVQTGPSRWLAPACDALAPPALLLTFGAGAVALAATWAGGRLPSWKSRLAVAAVGGAVVVGAFALAFPACLDGPYHAVPEPIRGIWLSRITEASSIAEMLDKSARTAFLVYGPLFTATIAAWIGAWLARGEARRLLLASATILSVAFVLSLFQIRAVYLGCVFVPIAAAWVLDRALRAATVPGRAPRAIAAVLASLLFFEGTWGMASRVATRLDVVANKPPLDFEKLWSCFGELPKMNALPAATILGPLDLGAHTLFLTHHSIIAAGYHRNVEGIVGGIQAFDGSAEDMLDVARRDHADYVAVCLPWLKFKPEQYGPFAQALGHGRSVPWLEPVDLSFQWLRLWRVRLPAQ